MISVELTVSLKIPDVTALTAANAIRRRLGYADTLLALERADYYRLDLDLDDPEEALALAREMAENTNIFVNPNKHRYEVRLADGRDRNPKRDGKYVVSVLIRNSDDTSGETIRAALHDRHHYDAVQSVEAGTLWRMHLDAESPEAAREMAEDITVTRSQDRGVLMNPHFQEYEIWMGE